MLKRPTQPIHIAWLMTLLALCGYSLVSNAEEPMSLETITVTADKMEQDKQDVSSNITVFDGYALEDQGVNTIEDISNRTPNVSFYRADSHTTYLVYRGIGGTTNMNKVWNVNLDGVTVPYVATDTLLDVKRVEVLRGGQGALYGRNTHAGVVNVITRDPDDVFTTDASATYESYNTFKLNAAAGGPIDDNKGYRIAFGYKSGDGFFENDVLNRDDSNDHEQTSARTKFVFNNDADNKLTLTLTADRFDGGFDSYVAGGGTHTVNNEPGYVDGYLLSPSLTWERQMGAFKLTSISNYSRSNYGFLHDWDFTEMAITTGEFDENTRSLSQEFRLESTAENGMKWQLGAFLMHEKLDTETIMRLGADAGVFGMPSNAFQGQESDINTRAAALFGQLIYPFHQQWEVTARLRLDYERKEMNWRGFSDMYSDINKSFEQDWSAVSPYLALAWLLQDNQRIYGSISSGYKAGDYNNVQLDPAVVTQAVDPEYTRTYELGYKGLFKRRFELNAALFYIDWEDLQVETPLSTAGTPIYLKQNAAEAHSTGLELEMRALLDSGWELSAGAGYLFEYKFDSFPNSTSGDLSGKHLPSANEFNVNASALYRHSNGVFFSLDAMLNGPKYFDEANVFEQDTYTLVNTKIGYETDNLSVYFYARNLLDEDYSVAMFANAEMAGEPRILGIQARVSY